MHAGWASKVMLRLPNRSIYQQNGLCLCTNLGLHLTRVRNGIGCGIPDFPWNVSLKFSCYLNQVNGFLLILWGKSPMIFFNPVSFKRFYFAPKCVKKSSLQVTILGPNIFLSEKFTGPLTLCIIGKKKLRRVRCQHSNVRWIPTAPTTGLCWCLMPRDHDLNRTFGFFFWGHVSRGPQLHMS